MDISVTIKDFESTFSVCAPNIPAVEGTVSQNFDYGPSYFSMSKNG